MGFGAIFGWGAGCGGGVRSADAEPDEGGGLALTPLPPCFASRFNRTYAMNPYNQHKLCQMIAGLSLTLSASSRGVCNGVPLILFLELKEIRWKSKD